jgi:hypothetical protein
MGMPPMLPGGGGGPTPQSPALQTILGALANRTGAGGGPGQTLSKQMADVQGADPQMILKQLESVNQVLGVLFVKTFQTLPNVANQISATMKALSRSIKEAQQASQVGEVVGQNENAPQPISFTPAMGGENAPLPQPVT